MEKVKAIQIMTALAQSTRLDVYQTLISVHPNGLAAGEIATATGTAPTSLSGHLAILERVGLLTSERSGRSIIYRADPSPVLDLSGFLNQAAVGRA